MLAMPHSLRGLPLRQDVAPCVQNSAQFGPRQYKVLLSRLLTATPAADCTFSVRPCKLQRGASDVV